MRRRRKTRRRKNEYTNNNKKRKVRTMQKKKKWKHKNNKMKGSRKMRMQERVTIYQWGKTQKESSPRKLNHDHRGHPHHHLL